MIWHRALAWAAVLALVATVSIAPLPARILAPGVALAQDDSATEAGEPTDLAVVALNCAEAPNTEALTSFFTDGTPPNECAFAAGVTVSVTENGDPVPGSPFTTDDSGTVTLPVSLGSAVEVREDPKSLPSGYEPLAQEANSVPYANPVRLDPAVAGAAVLFVNVPTAVATELAQGAPAVEAGEPTDLTIVALQCADAPAAEALTSFFSIGSPPGGCAPAEGVSIAVTENEKPLSGSPFTTDTDGTLAVRVGLGSEVTIKEDPKSLPAGYEPITQEANGVPYANPVQLESATPEAAVLFVNVPASVAAKLKKGTPAVDAGGASNLANAGTRNRTGCDPAYPDERTCIPPGRPLAAPCAITDQRNFTVLPPDPRRLDADGDGIGCEPVSPRGGTTIRAASPNQTTSGGYLRRAAPARTGYAGVAASPVYRNYGVRSAPPQASRGADWMVRRDGNRAGLWFVSPARTSTGSVAIASNPVFISGGLWSWSNRFGNDDWFWQNRNHNHDGNWFWRNRNLNGSWFRPSIISVGNLTIAGSGSGSGNIAIASNPVFISNGLWRWSGQTHNDGWFWNGRDHDDGRSWNGHDHNDWSWRDRVGSHVWGWPSRISVGNLTVARSGNGLQNVAIASNPIFISGGLWSWQNRPGNDDWFWRNRQGNNDWRWRNRQGNDDWRWRNRFGNHIWGWPSHISVGNITIAGSGNGNGNVAIASNPVFISGGVWHWPGHINNGGWLWNNHRNNGQWRGSNHFGTGVWGWPRTIFVGNLTIARSGDNIAIVSNPIVIISSGLWFVPHDRDHDRDWFNHDDRDHGDNDHDNRNDGDRDHDGDQQMQSGAAQADGSDVEPMTINGSGSSEAPSKIASAGSSEQPTVTVNGTLAVEPPPTESMQQPSDGATQPAAEPDQPTSDGDVALPSEGSVETPSDGTGGAPPDAAIEPAADAGAADLSYVAPDPSSVNGGTVDAGSVDAGSVDAGYVASDPGTDPSYVAPDPGIDPGYVAPDPAVDAGYVDPGYVDPSYVAPEPSYVDPGNAAPEPSYVEPAYVEPTYVEPSYVDPAYADPGYVAPEPNYVAPEPIYSAPEPSYVDPGIDAGYVAPEPNYAAPEPSYSAPEPNYVAPEPSYVDAGNVAPNPGMDAGNSGPDANNFAPEPSFADPGMDAGNGNRGNADSGNIAPDAGMDIGGNVDAGAGAPDAGGGSGGGRGKRNNRD